MFPYWLLYSVFAMGALTHRFEPHASGRWSPLFIIAALFTTIFIGLRFETGGDWFNYVDIFVYSSESLTTALREGDPGFMLLNWIGKQLGERFWFVTLSCAALFVWGLARFARQEPNPWLTVLVAVPYLVIVVGMGYIRQAAAIALLLAAMSEFIKGRLVRVVVFAALASLFHRSAIAMLPIIVVSVVRHRTLIWGFMAALAVVSFDFLLGDVLAKLSRGYIETGLTSEGAGVRVAMNLLPAIIFLIFSRRFSRNEQERLLWRNISLLAVISVAALALTSSSTVIDRMALYLIPIQLIVLGRAPYVFSIKGRPHTQLILAIALYAGAIQFVWFNFAFHADRWLPYRSALFQEW